MSINAKKLPAAVKNQSLFSDYYLESLIVEQPQWVDTPEIESDYAAIKQLFDAVAPNAPNRNEAQLEHEFIQPLLKWLGHVFEVQPTLQTPQGRQTPRLCLLRLDGSPRGSATSHQHKPVLPNRSRPRRRQGVVPQPGSEGGGYRRPVQQPESELSDRLLSPMCG